MKARDIMTVEPVCCTPEDSVTRAAEIMAHGHWGCLPVVDARSRRIVGILTDRDLALRVVAQGRPPANIRVGEVMSRGVVCCRADEDLEDIEQYMRSHRVRRIPVVDARARVIGIISQADLALRALRPRRALDADALARTVEAISEPLPRERL
jgi:CBS domain-containing protein